MLFGDAVWMGAVAVSNNTNSDVLFVSGESGEVQLHVDDQQLQLLPGGDGRGAEVVDLLRRRQRQAQVVLAGQPQRTGRGEQGLPVPLPAARLLQQVGSARQVQVLHPQRQAGRDQSHGVATGLQIRSRKGLGIQEVHQTGLLAGRS